MPAKTSRPAPRTLSLRLHRAHADGIALALSALVTVATLSVVATTTTLAHRHHAALPDLTGH
jgi:hypothetical protein